MQTIAALAFVLAGALQAADPAAWNSYFLTVAQSKDADAAVVRVATEYREKGRSLDPHPLVFEARLRATTGDSTAWLEEQLQALEARRTKMLAEELRDLKAALGDERFEALDRHVAEWHKALLDGPPGPRPRARK